MLLINLKKYVSLGLLAFALSSILCATDSYAVFENLTRTGGEIFEGMKGIIFGAAGFGIIAIAIGSFFGALNWKWLSAIIIGLVVISATAGIINYLAAGTGADISVSGISDTLKSGE
jgi:type IV secretory pathway VirB2 component (pilin)